MKIPVLLTLVLAVANVAAAADIRVSGTVAAIEGERDTLIVEELTAAAGPEPVVARRTIAVGRDTRVELIRRAADGTTSWRDDYTAAPLSRDEVKPGDFVTVTGEIAGDTVRAQAITVVRFNTPR